MNLERKRPGINLFLSLYLSRALSFSLSLFLPYPLFPGQDIYDAKVSLVLGLLWNMIQNYQFQLEAEPAGGGASGG